MCVCVCAHECACSSEYRFHFQDLYFTCTVKAIVPISSFSLKAASCLHENVSQKSERISSANLQTTISITKICRSFGGFDVSFTNVRCQFRFQITQTDFWSETLRGLLLADFSICVDLFIIWRLSTTICVLSSVLAVRSWPVTNLSNWFTNPRINTMKFRFKIIYNELCFLNKSNIEMNKTYEVKTQNNNCWVDPLPYQPNVSNHVYMCTREERQELKTNFGELTPCFSCIITQVSIEKRTSFSWCLRSVNLASWSFNAHLQCYGMSVCSASYC